LISEGEFYASVIIGAISGGIDTPGTPDNLIAGAVIGAAGCLARGYVKEKSPEIQLLVSITSIAATIFALKISHDLFLPPMSPIFSTNAQTLITLGVINIRTQISFIYFPLFARPSSSPFSINEAIKPTSQAQEEKVGSVHEDLFRGFDSFNPLDNPQRKQIQRFFHDSKRQQLQTEYDRFKNNSSCPKKLTASMVDFFDAEFIPKKELIDEWIRSSQTPFDSRRLFDLCDQNGFMLKSPEGLSKNQFEWIRLMCAHSSFNWKSLPLCIKLFLKIKGLEHFKSKKLELGDSFELDGSMTKETPQSVEVDLQLFCRETLETFRRYFNSHQDEWDALDLNIKKIFNKMC
jgi:hypothetical protein